jgi:ABC-2 type transport system permease protein
MWRRSVTLALHNARLLRTDPASIALMLVLPVVMMAFLQPTAGLALRAQGVEGANGAEHVVPGMVVMFSFFLIAFVGMLFFHEHGWGTWERLRASDARPLEVLVGKCVPTAALMIGQLTVLFVAGSFLFDLRVRGSLVALVMVVLALAACLMGLAMGLVSVCRSTEQMNVVVNLLGIVVAGLGGALAPLDVMPGWAQAAAPFTPAYWALDGFRRVIIDGGGTADVAGPVLVLVAIGAVGAIVAARRFRFEHTKDVSPSIAQ